MKISEKVAAYLKRNADHPEKIDKFAEFLENFFKDLEEEDMEIREAFEEDVEDFVYEITEEKLYMVMKKFKHKDNTVSGIKWTKEEVASVVNQYDIKNRIITYGKDFCDLHFWFAMNYVYATHYNPNRSTSGYVELAMDEYCNKNMSFKEVIKKMNEEEHPEI